MDRLSHVRADPSGMVLLCQVSTCDSLDTVTSLLKSFKREIFQNSLASKHFENLIIIMYTCVKVIFNDFHFKVE